MLVCLFNIFFAYANTNSSAGGPDCLSVGRKSTVNLFIFSETPCGPAATAQTGFFFTLSLFGLHIGDFSLELTPEKLHRSLSLSAAASQVSRHFYTSVNTTNYATHTAGPVVLFM